MRRAAEKLVMAGALALAGAAPAMAKGDEDGLPMWRVRDADSVIYITGSVHALAPGLPWRSAKLNAALASAQELWLEMAEIGKSGAFDPALFKADGAPLSQHLTAAEFARLTELLRKARLPVAAIATLDKMKPSFVALTLGMTNILARGANNDNIDLAIAKIAREQGRDIKGFETPEQQLAMIAGGTQEEQLAALRMAMDEADKRAGEARRMDKAVAAWTHGKVAPMQALHARKMRLVARRPGGKQAFAAVLDNRNERWAEAIAAMLKGKGVSFVAVGAMHLVGDQRLQRRLAARGIKVERY